MQPRAWHQGGQTLHELQGRHHQVGGAVAPGRLELEYDLPSGVGLHARVGQRRAGDVAAQLFQRLALVSAAAHGTSRPRPAGNTAGVRGAASWFISTQGVQRSIRRQPPYANVVVAAAGSQVAGSGLGY